MGNDLNKTNTHARGNEYRDRQSYTHSLNRSDIASFGYTTYLFICTHKWGKKSIFRYIHSQCEKRGRERKRERERYTISIAQCVRVYIADDIV